MNKELKTKRLVLKEILDQDKEKMIAIFSDPLVSKTYMIPSFNNDQEKEDFFYRLKRITKERIAYGIYYHNEIVGFINEVSKDSDKIEVGYFIDSKEWNKGIATEALKAMILELFELGFKIVIAGYFDFNIASKRVMEKCGMEAIKQEDIIEYRGNNYLCKYYSITRK